MIIDKIYKQFGKGMELISFASKLKNSLYRFPGLPDDVVSLLKNKYEMIRKIGNRLIIQDNPSLFDDLWMLIYIIWNIVSQLRSEIIFLSDLIWLVQFNSLR